MAGNHRLPTRKRASGMATRFRRGCIYASRRPRHSGINPDEAKGLPEASGSARFIGLDSAGMTAKNEAFRDNPLWLSRDAATRGTKDGEGGRQPSISFSCEPNFTPATSQAIRINFSFWSLL